MYSLGVMKSDGQDIVSFALKMGFQVHPDVFTLLMKLEPERRTEIVSSIIEKKKEAPPPAMTSNDTRGNLETLDSWRKNVGYKLPQE